MFTVIVNINISIVHITISIVHININISIVHINIGIVHINISTAYVLKLDFNNFFNLLEFLYLIFPE